MTYLFTNNQEIKNDIGDPITVVYGDSVNTQMDAVGRLRVSPPVQSYWYTPTIDKDGDLRYIEAFSGTGATSAFVQHLAGVLVTSGSDSNGSAIRASRRRFKMRPGVSLFWSGTFSFNGVNQNTTKRRGLFTPFNGTFFELTNDLTFVIRRRLIDGTLVEERINRADFLYDKLDGTGPTGYNMNPADVVTFPLGAFVSKTATVISPTETHYNVVFSTSGIAPYRLGTKVNITGFAPMTYNSLGLVVAKTSSTITISYPTDPGTLTSGTGTLSQSGLHHQYTWWFDMDGDRTTRIRFGVLSTSGPHVCHIVNFGGQLGTNFSNAPALTERTEIVNNGPITIRPTMTLSSTAINVEAELELNPGFAVARNNTGVTLTVGQERAIIGVGLRPGEPYQRGDIQVQSVSSVDLNNVPGKNIDSSLMYWRLLFNPALGGTIPTPTDIGKCSRQWAFTANTTFSGGIELMAGYVVSGSDADVRTSLNFLNLGSNIDYTDADKLVLTLTLLRPGGNTTSIAASSMNIIEAL